ncbi:MFS transporter [Patulibacter sp. SYSU D01012]|uniref:MFS transporter n=1 Tax=Patulibacter sp. SYSU D01012 TaxID=2817381 RepID=UPI001B3122DE|nr:MFS transporter [Patulibacter sp. SYSU D01012]
MATPAPSAAHADPHHERRWLILAVLGLAQLMVVLDATIVNIALPSAQESLGFTDESRQWIITAYALAFGSLLLLGGRIGDLVGRKPVFITGLIGFALASALGGAAGSFGVLVVARALQGVFGALLAPAALSLLTTTFTNPEERGKAFGVFGAIAGAGAGIGLLLGGLLTEYLSWRWCLYVNLVFAVPAALGAMTLLHGGTQGHRTKLDIPGTLSITLGLFALVYGFSNAETDSWTAPLTIVCLVVAVVLVVAFVLIELRVEHPLLPLRVVTDRNRGGSYMAFAIVGIGMFGVFLFLTYYLQQTRGYSPVKTGLAFLPMNFAIMGTATTATVVLLGRFGPRILMTLGMVLAALGMVLFAQLDVDSSYLTGVLPGLLVLGVGLGLVFAPGMETATTGLGRADAGVGSAMVNTVQQVGGSIGTALLSTIFTSSVTSFTESNRALGPKLAVEGPMHGYITAFWWAAAIIAVGAVIVGLLLRSGVVERDADAEPVMAH